MLSELFEQLPEVGDPEKPKLVFFFDEAHLLFTDVPKPLEEKIVQVVRLIRSKGVGVYFVTQNPLDLPETVLGQLGHRVQHALRAFTPRDQKTVNAAAQTFRPNPKLNVEKVITELAVGEALVSVLDDKGTPTIVERALVYPPRSRLTPLTPEERRRIIQGSVIYGHYEKTIDRESAYERLRARTEPSPSEPQQKPFPPQRGAEPKPETIRLLEAMAKSAAHAVGSQIGRQIIRGVLGSLFGSGRKG
jgi:DNA helicase HerA-like ATPase